MRSFIVCLLFFVIVAVLFASYITVFKFDIDNGRWDKTYYSIGQTSPSMKETYSSHPAESGVFERTTFSIQSEPRWYYYFTYAIGSSNEYTPTVASFIADQNKTIGSVAVWNDINNLYVEYRLSGGWFLMETHLNCSEVKPSGMPVIGLFPYCEENHNTDTDNIFLYTIPLIEDGQKKPGKPAPGGLDEHNWSNGTVLYILAHAEVRKIHEDGTVQEETAWGGEPPNYICVDLSATLSSWFVRKPGQYYANPVTATIRASHDFTITFSGFNNLQHEQGTGESVSVLYAFGDNAPANSQWITSQQLNSLQLDMPMTEGTQWRIWQKIEIGDQSICRYSNIGTITFTLQNFQTQVFH